MEKKEERTYTVKVSDSLEKWKDNQDVLAELLPEVAAQLADYMAKVSDAAKNFGQFLEQNKDLAPFLKVGLVISGEVSCLGDKLAESIIVLGEDKIIKSKIMSLGLQMLSKEAADV